MPNKWLYVIDEAVKRIENDELELGLQALQKVQEHGKALPEVMLYLAEVWYQLGHVEEAAALLSDVLNERLDLDYSLRQEFQLMLAEVLLDLNDFEKAQQLLYDLKEEGCDEIQMYLLLADLYASQELDEVAVKYLEIAREREPENEHIAAALGNLYIRIGRPTDAIELLEEVDHQGIDALLFKARTLGQNGEFEEAYNVYREALKQEQTPEILYNCGLIGFHLGRLQEAEAVIERLLALDEDYLVAYSLLSDIYLSLGKTEKSIELLKKYVDLSGFDLEQIKRLIALLTQSGRYEEAKEYQKLYDQWNVEEE